MRSLFVFVFSLVLLTPAMAQDSLTLEQAIMAALKNNYDILLTRNQHPMHWIIHMPEAAFLPQLNATAGTTWNRNNQQLKFSKRNGGGDSSVTRDAVKQHNTNYALNLNWTLFDGLKCLPPATSWRKLEKLGELGIKTQVINTVATVVNGYYIIVRQKTTIKSDRRADIHQ